MVLLKPTTAKIRYALTKFTFHYGSSQTQYEYD